MAIDLILGTAGHIDHGKTALVKALTGVDTDRLPEEKRRGITIDLGFAELDLPGVRLGIVDVPGHERFVRTMLAGASGIDLALLAIAADDSVKPQTLEHFEILKLMNLSAGVIALTKCDIAEPDWIDLVEDEVAELVLGSFLENAPIVRTSAKTGEGLDKLRSALAHTAASVAARREDTLGEVPFRMAIDRVFTIAGHGTVVTGSVSSGRARAGDALRIEPLGLDVRVRALQNHDRPVEEIRRSQRAALNLAGVHHTEIGRGDELCSPGHLVPSRLLTVRLDLLPSSKRALRHRDRVRLHIGAAERPAEVSLFVPPDGAASPASESSMPAQRRREVPPGNSAFAQLLVNEPVATAWGQPFVIRRLSPAHTIGGGVVLDPNALRIRAAQSERARCVAELQNASPLERASSAIRLRGTRPWRETDLARLAGVWGGERAVAELVRRGDVIAVATSPTHVRHVHRQALNELGRRVEKSLTRFHEDHPLVREAPLAEFLSSFRRDRQYGDLWESAIKMLAQSGIVRLTDRGISLAGRGPELSAGEQRLFEEIVGRFQVAGLQPPTTSEVHELAKHNRAAVGKLLELAAADGLLVAISKDLYFHRDALAAAREKVAQALVAQPLTVSDVRDLLGTTRKYAVPLCEYFDKTGLTRRDGDYRVLK
jgi:selenocysteine-specific elongation factor